MSLKSIVMKCCPGFLYSVARKVYQSRTIRTIYYSGTIRKALKYLPYYQDELSREILADRIEYLKTCDKNIFLRRAQKEGWKFPGIQGRYSGLVAVYNAQSDDLVIEYIKNIASVMNITARFVPLREFLKNGRANDSELVVFLARGRESASLKKEIENYLSSNNIHCDVRDGISSARDDEQYFDVFAPSEDEIVVDAGAYDGATALRFLKWGGDKIKHIYSFEFDPVNAVRCEEIIKPYRDKITVIRKGTWDTSATFYIKSGGAGSTITTKGSTKVQLASIDSELAGVPVTFIKMDVERAELKSLMGAKNTIIKNRPRLAICLYHRTDDIYAIPGYILSLVPDYKFYLRHYGTSAVETVLYAYCE